MQARCDELSAAAERQAAHLLAQEARDSCTSALAPAAGNVGQQTSTRTINTKKHKAHKQQKDLSSEMAADKETAASASNQPPVDDITEHNEASGTATVTLLHVADISSISNEAVSGDTASSKQLQPAGTGSSMRDSSRALGHSQSSCADDDSRGWVTVRGRGSSSSRLPQQQLSDSRLHPDQVGNDVSYAGRLRHAALDGSAVAVVIQQPGTERHSNAQQAQVAAKGATSNVATCTCLPAADAAAGVSLSTTSCDRSSCNPALAEHCSSRSQHAETQHAAATARMTDAANVKHSHTAQLHAASHTCPQGPQQQQRQLLHHQQQQEQQQTVQLQVPLPEWIEEAYACIADTCPAAAALDVQPQHVLGIGLNTLSACQLEALEVRGLLTQCL